MRKLLNILLVILVPGIAFAQFPANPVKMRLGYQTTGQGLIFYGLGAPAYTPSSINDAYAYVDTQTGDYYQYNVVSAAWEIMATQEDAANLVDSTRLIQDSILVSWIGAVEVKRDTLQLGNDQQPLSTSEVVGIVRDSGFLEVESDPVFTEAITNATQDNALTEFLVKDGSNVHTRSLSSIGDDVTFSGLTQYRYYTVDGSGNLVDGGVYADDVNYRYWLGSSSTGSTDPGSLDQVAIGRRAGESNTGGDQIAIGYLVGSNNTGNDQVAIGNISGQSNTGDRQIALGSSTGTANSGVNQIALGQLAGQNNSGANQVSIGAQSGRYNQGGNQITLGVSAGNSNIGLEQIALGNSAGSDNTGDFQVAIGYLAGDSNTASNQTAIGQQAGQNNTGTFQVTLGHFAGKENTGTYNTTIGYYAGHNNQGNYQIAIGEQSGRYNQGTNNITLGFRAGYSVSGTIPSPGGENFFAGYQSGYSIEEGSHNIGIGRQSLFRITDGEYNIGIGRASLYNLTTGDNNITMGFAAGNDMTTANNNVAIGYQAMRSNITGGSNTAVGFESLHDNTSYDNTALGYRSAYHNTTGNTNTAIGHQALFQNETGSRNVALGFTAGRYIADGVTANTASDNSIFIGYDSRPDAISQTNQIVIGYQAVGLGSNTAVLGNGSITDTYLSGSLHIGVATQDNALTKIAVLDANDQLFWRDVSTISTSLSTILSTSPDAGANKITNLSNPTSNQDAATKAYVDENAGTRSWGPYRDRRTSVDSTLSHFAVHNDIHTFIHDTTSNVTLTFNTTGTPDGASIKIFISKDASYGGSLGDFTLATSSSTTFQEVAGTNASTYTLVNVPNGTGWLELIYDATNDKFLVFSNF